MAFNGQDFNFTGDIKQENSEVNSSAWGQCSVSADHSKLTPAIKASQPATIDKKLQRSGDANLRWSDQAIKTLFMKIMKKYKIEEHINKPFHTQQEDGHPLNTVEHAMHKEN